MKSVLVCAGLGLLGVNALGAEKRDNPAVVKLNLQKNTPPPPPARLRTRQGEVQTPDINYQTSLLYIVELQIGTPPQSTYVQLDTGSSDLIVETPSSDICSAAPPNPCTNFGSYDANASSTYQYIDSNFQVAYAGGDGATGDWGSDIVSIGGATLQNVQFGVMYETTVLEGILGVSYPIIEGRNTFSGEPVYPNFPSLLVQQGYIASRAFSLYTNDDRLASGGTLLFGGIDTNKFSGMLVTIDLIPSGFDNFPGVVDFTIALQGITGTAGGQKSTFSTTATNVVMDSGTTLTLLPPAIVDEIWSFVGTTPYSSSPDSSYILCSDADTTKIIQLEFSGITINVPISQLLQDDGTGYCAFGIVKQSGTQYIVGDNCLSSMYVVYDLDNNQISLAPAVFGSTSENILQIMAGPNGVPDTSSSSTSTSSTSTSTSSSSTSTSSSSTSNPPTTMTTTTKPTTTKPTATVPLAPLKCDNNNCLNAMIHLSATALSFCKSYLGGLAAPTPTNIANGCSALPSKISSGCSCIFSGTVPPPSTGPSTSTTATTTTTMAPVPLRCNMDNCLRAIEHIAIPATFCSPYLAGAAIAIPTNVNAGCATSASRISSACSCAATAANP